MDHDDTKPSLASLLMRSTELKRALVDFAVSPRYERHLARFMEEAGHHGRVLPEDEAINGIDRFALQHRMPGGGTVLSRFLASRPDLTAPDREMLHGWAEPVEGIFEICRKDRDSLVLLNLIDDLEYRAYSNVGPSVFRPLPLRGYVLARLVPIRPVPDVWLVSGTMSAYPESDAAQIAEAALKLAMRLPELVYRNPKSLERGWKQMRSSSSSAEMRWSFRPPRPKNDSTPITVTGKRPRWRVSPPGTGGGTSQAWTCPPSSSRLTSLAQTPSA
jgi:hypothetical protein